MRSTLGCPVSSSRPVRTWSGWPYPPPATGRSPTACRCSARSTTPTSSPGSAWPGAAADATYREIVRLRFAGRRETDVAADLARMLREFEHEQVDFTVVGSGPTVPTRTTRPGTG